MPEGATFQRILLTGARGFLGRAVYGHLRRTWPQAEVVAVGHSAAAHFQDPPGPALDLTGSAAWLSLGRRFDFVCHLAARLPGAEEPTGEEVFEDNLRMAEALVKACRRWRPILVVFASTIAVYPPGAASVLREDLTPHPDTAYGRSKLAAEQCLEAVDQAGCRLTCLRFSSLYGPGMERQAARGVLWKFLDQALRGQGPTVFGAGLRTQDFLHLEDAARGILAAAQAESGGVFNLGSGRPTSMLELAQTALRVTGREDLAVRYIQEAPEDASVVLDISRAGRTLGYRPRIEIAAGLRELAELVTENAGLGQVRRIKK